MEWMIVVLLVFFLLYVVFPEITGGIMSFFTGLAEAIEDIDFSDWSDD